MQVVALSLIARNVSASILKIARYGTFNQCSCIKTPIQMTNRGLNTVCTIVIPMSGHHNKK